MPPRMVPIAPEGWAFILVPLVLALALAGAGWLKVAAVVGVVAAFMAFFFRDPERTPPSLPGAILAPADGKVLEVRDGLDDPFVGPARMVSIFLSPLDVHVNRAPLGGLVVGVEYRPGEKVAAYRPDAGERNERTVVAIQGEAARVVVRQVAGALARRIVCRVRPGDKVALGERFGLIKFGSRTDVVMPAAADVRVRRGDRVRGGETVVGVLP
jgi:phosphatidylserine decarboxylase